MHATIGYTTLLLLLACRLSGQTTTNVASHDANSPASNIEEATEKKWTFSASAYTYIVPDSREYVQPTITANRGPLHLEARYNYESIETGSAWVGYTFGAGEKLAWEFTPMLGGVFGNLTGVAPGYKGSISWWKLELYSEGEYFIDPSDESENFFYNWSELTIAPVEWLRVGMVTQRTRAYDSDREIQRGALVGFSLKRLDLTAYVFNPDESRPIWVVAAGFSF
jgi:hypothetical protein